MMFYLTREQDLWGGLYGLWWGKPCQIVRPHPMGVLSTVWSEAPLNENGMYGEQVAVKIVTIPNEQWMRTEGPKLGPGQSTQLAIGAVERVLFGEHV